METNKNIIAVISENSEIYNLICRFPDEINNYHFNILNYELFLNDINPDIIFIDEKNKELTKDIIKNIRIKLPDKDIQVIVGIEEDNIKLNDYIKVGANDYILKPYEENKIFIRLKNSMDLVKGKKDTRLRTILFNSLLNNGPYMSWFKDNKSNYMIVNDEFMEHSGKELELIRGNGDSFVWDGKIGDKCREYDLEVMNTRKRKIFDEVIPGKKGYKQFNIYKAPVIDEYDRVIGTIGVARDITELKNKDTKMNIILDNIPLAVWVKDKNGIILNVNKEYLNFTNIEEDDILGKDESRFFDKEKEILINKTDKEVIKHKSRVIYEIFIEKDGEERILEVHKSAILDISNEVIGIVGVFRDITEIKKIAYTDMLTELPNRRALYDYVSNNIKNIKESISFILIDLDNFKKLNDSCGHNAGDNALVVIGKKLKNIFENEFIARIGGDEFVLVILDEKEEVIRKRADELTENLKTEFVNNDISNIISVSVGIVMESSKNITIEKLLLKADIALYKAKENGKNQYVLYSEELEAEKILEMQIENDLGKAIRLNEIELYYQGQYSIDGALKGFEALFRWNNPKYSKVPINKIIEILEKSYLVNSIGDYIIDSACKFCKHINDISNNNLTISINLSAVQIMSNNFVQNIKSIITKNKVNPELICIEITETVLIENINENVGKLRELINFGVKISLDDFGIGYSSLNYLVTLPLSEVKIDKSFVVEMRGKEQYKSLIKLIVEAVHSLNLPLVAEGVEEEEELLILKDFKVDYIQGYIFSKPLSSKEVIKLLLNNNSHL